MHRAHGSRICRQQPAPYPSVQASALFDSSLERFSRLEAIFPFHAVHVHS